MWQVKYSSTLLRLADYVCSETPFALVCGRRAGKGERGAKRSDWRSAVEAERPAVGRRRTPADLLHPANAHSSRRINFIGII